MRSFEGFLTRRLRLTRIFAIGGAIVLAIAAVGLGRYTGTVAEAELHRMAETHNVEFARVLANSIWPRFAPHIGSARMLGAEATRSQQDTVALRDLLDTLTSGTRIMKIKLYDADGWTAFSTDPAQIGEDQQANSRFLKARNGHTVSRLEHRASFDGFNGAREDLWILSSYVPLRMPGSDVITGIAEIYSDVTELRASITAATWRQTTAIAAVFLLAFIILVAVLGRAERREIYEHARALRMATARAKAEAASRSKSDFLANMSHELRTPLNAIIGFSELIHSEAVGPVGQPRYKEYAADILQSGRRLLGLVENVLELAHIETGTSRAHMTQVDLRDLAGGIIRELRNQPESQGKTILLETDATVSAIESDPEKLHIALVNLVSNGLKFSGPGAVVRIGIQSVGHSGDAVISISDSGIGMREEDIPLALAPFSQIEPVLTRRHSGVGLGLPLAKRLIETLGGRLHIASAPGSGTTLIVTLPSKQPHPPSQACAV